MNLLKTEPSPPTLLAGASRAEIQDQAQINILIVDDEPKNLMVLETVLEDPEYRLVRASSAEEALLALVTHQFALLILDIRMPGMNGFELAQMIKQRKKTSEIPIIFLTAYYNEDQHVLEGYSSGAVDYLHKPVNATVLRSKVAVFVELYRRSRESLWLNRSLHAEISERIHAEEKLVDLNNTLEQKIASRTEQLRLNQAHLHQAAEAACLTYVELDFENNEATPAPNFSKVMGFEWQASNLDQISAGLLTGVIPEDQPALAKAFKAFIENGEADRVHYRVLGDDFVERWIESCWSCARSSDGALRKLFATNLDITSAKRSEENLRRSEARLRLALDSAELGYWRIDPAQGLLSFDHRFREITGTLESPIPYEQLLKSVHQDDRDCVRNALDAAVRGSDSALFETEYRIVLPGGAIRWLFAKGRTNVEQLGPGMDLVSIDGTVADITERKLVEENLRRANKDLEQFAFSASHDLQEPLRNVIIYSQLVQQRYANQLDEEAQLFLNLMVEGAKRASKLISDLLAYTEAVQSQTEAPGDVDATEVLKTVIGNLSARIQETCAEVTYGPMPSVPILAIHLELVLQNLIGNALKYRKQSESPRVQIAAVQENNCWQFSVSDNGIGVPEEYRKYIFGLFKRLHQSDEKYPGTGIGLAICVKVLERYGGRIWIESQPDQGTTFYFTIPIGLS
jgi:chemotaxis family two-component system sensor kinase Cph1